MGTGTLVVKKREGNSELGRDSFLHGNSHLCSAGPSREWEVDEGSLLTETYFSVKVVFTGVCFSQALYLNFLNSVFKKPFRFTRTG